MSNTPTPSSGGIGLFGLTFLVFLVLKLAEVGAVAQWSWWAVTAPLWAPLSLWAVILLILGAVTCLYD